MNKSKTYYLSIIIIGLIAGAISHSFHSYGEQKLFGIPVQLIMTILTFIGALKSKLLFKKNSFITAMLISVGVTIAVFCRIVFDVINDPTTHNLLPFEIILDSFLIGSSALVGSYLGQLINYLKTK